MTIVPLRTSGLAKIAAALRDGEAVLIPFASPLPYGVAATQASAVNRAKGRRCDQPCGILVGDTDELIPHLDLDPAAVELSLWIGDDRRGGPRRAAARCPRRHQQPLPSRRSRELPPRPV